MQRANLFKEMNNPANPILDEPPSRQKDDDPPNSPRKLANFTEESTTVTQQTEKIARSKEFSTYKPPVNKIVSRNPQKSQGRYDFSNTPHLVNPPTLKMERDAMGNGPRESGPSDSHKEPILWDLEQNLKHIFGNPDLKTSKSLAHISRMNKNKSQKLLFIPPPDVSDVMLKRVKKTKQIGTTNSDDFGTTKHGPDHGESPKPRNKKIKSLPFGRTKKVARSVGGALDDVYSDRQYYTLEHEGKPDEVVAHEIMLESWQELMRVSSVGDFSGPQTEEFQNTFYSQPIIRSPNGNFQSKTNYSGNIWNGYDLNDRKTLQKQSYQQNHYPHLYTNSPASHQKNPPINKFNSFGKMPQIQIEPSPHDLGNDHFHNFTLNDSKNAPPTVVGDYIDKFCRTSLNMTTKNQKVHRNSTTSALTELFNKAGPERPQDVTVKTQNKLSNFFFWVKIIFRHAG
jgi:hypothetical protein